MSLKRARPSDIEYLYIVFDICPNRSTQLAAFTVEPGDGELNVAMTQRLPVCADTRTAVIAGIGHFVDKLHERALRPLLHLVLVGNLDEAEDVTNDVNAAFMHVASTGILCMDKTAFGVRGDMAMYKRGWAELRGARGGPSFEYRTVLSFGAACVRAHEEGTLVVV